MPRQERILIVDDEWTYHDLIGRTLRKKYKNIELRSVTSSKEAIQEISGKDYDLVFLDVKLRGKNGPKTFKEIKTIKPDQKVCVMTEQIVEEEIVEAIKSGTCRALHKPFRIFEILEVVEEYLHK